jgi:methionyl aminopeptidase
VDLGANFEGWHADSATTFGVGTLSSAANNLIVVTKNALKEGVKKAREGNTIGDIGCAVYGYAVKNGLRPAHGLTGHFIGNKVHLEPSIPNVPPHPLAKDVKLVAGMTFCIEPMLVTGSGEVDVQADGWTICTKDGSLSAHFEHTVEVTAGGQPARILTRLAE